MRGSLVASLGLLSLTRTCTPSLARSLCFSRILSYWSSLRPSSQLLPAHVHPACYRRTPLFLLLCCHCSSGRQNCHGFLYLPPLVDDHCWLYCDLRCFLRSCWCLRILVQDGRTELRLYLAEPSSAQPTSTRCVHECTRTCTNHRPCTREQEHAGRVDSVLVSACTLARSFAGAFA